MKTSGVSWQKLLALGRLNPDDPDEPVNMAYLAVRGSGRINGVIKLHGEVSRRLLHNLVPDVPEDETVEEAANVLDPAALTLGIARRFAEYKRPTLILHDKGRLRRILTHVDRPVQLVVAGKAHPRDEDGKRLIQAMAQFAFQGDLRRRVVFLEDYDMSLAEHLVQGVDVWINTPLRPWEASGTSGMKVLVNGGLNLSELDGWWAEAYRPDVGWALGDGREHLEPEWTEREAR